MGRLQRGFRTTRLHRVGGTAVLACALLGVVPAWAQFASPFDVGRQQQITELVNRGRAALDGGRPQEAFQAFQDVLRLEPNHVEAHFRLGTILWVQRNIPQALQLMQRSAELAPNNPSLRLSVGGYFEQANILDRAIEHYRAAAQLLEGTPEFKEADKRLNLALVKDYGAKGDMDTSLQLLNALVAEYPDDMRVIQHLGFAYVLANRLEDAAQVYLDVLAREPNNDAAHLNLANVYERMGDFPRAVTHFNKVVELNADAGRVLEAKTRVRLITATQMQQQGSLELAAAELERALQEAPNHPLVNTRLAGIYRELKRFDDAEAALNKIVEAAPDNLDAHLQLGKLYLERNNYIDGVWHLDWVVNRGGNTPLAEEARQMLTQLESTFGDQVQGMRTMALNKNQFKQRIAANPNDIEARFNLGVILVGQQMWDKARVEFETVRDLDPSIARAYLNLAQIYTQLGRFKEAGDAVLTYISLETDPNVADTNVGYFAMLLGQKLYEEQQSDAALYQFRRVLEVAPNDVLAQFYIGLILGSKGQLEEAAQAYEKVLERAPTHIGARTNLALIYEQLGKEAEALAHYRRIALSAPPGQIKQTAEARAVLLQRSVNGLTSTASYGMTLDNNANLSEANPQEEYSSNLSGSFVYRYKYSDKLRLGMSVAPTYTIYHVGQYDYLNVSYEPFINYGPPQEAYSLRYSRQEVSGVLNEQNFSVTQSLTVDHTRELEFGRGLSPSFSYRRYESQANSLFDADTWTGRIDYQRALGRGLSDNASYSFAYNVPLGEAAQNADQEYLSNSVSYQLTKWLTTDVYVSANGNLSITNYLNEDRFGCKKRLNWTYSAGLSLNYRFNESIRAFASATYIANGSNLPLFVFDPTLQGPTTLCDGQIIPQGGIRPVTGEELIGVPLTNASLGEFTKQLVTFGLSVSF